MSKRMELLPNWELTNKKPAFYDTESATVIEETALLYGKMQDLINDYNLFANEVNKAITSFTTETEQNQECFKTSITKLIEDYIKSIDMKTDELTAYLKTNLVQTINDLYSSGEIDQELLNVFNRLDTRVKTIENTEYVLSYEDGTETLKLEKVVNGGV